MGLSLRFTIFLLLSSIFLGSCSSATSCPVTKPEWVLPPEDAAVLNTPGYGYYYVNEDRSIWSSAYWPESQSSLYAGKEGNKVGWYRPAGASMEIIGKRLDGSASGFEAKIPCCYPTRFQATGLYFSTQGCWEISAKAADKQITYIVWVEP